ncbi:MAG: NAD(P)/FAD-dependent oxidoreductase [Patulibacter minatonensis]
MSRPAPSGAPVAPTVGALADRYDAVVIGGGHNGLTCAAYLARGGVDVLVVEARTTVGGCASTEEVLGGARVNVCNCDHSLVRATGIIDDLELERHGLRYLELDPAQVMTPWDGSPAWVLCNDPDRTLQSLALTYPRELANYRRHLDELRPVAELVLAMTSGAPEIGAVARQLARLRGRGLKGLLRLGRMSCTDVLRTYFRDEALLAAPATTGPSVWGLDPSRPGTGLGALGFVLRHVLPVGRPVGGSGRLTDALGAAVRAHGGTILTGRRVTQIRTAGGRTAGVTLDDGRRIAAGTVIAAANPHEALAHLLQSPTGGAGERLVRRWRAKPAHGGYESKVDALIDELPRPHRLTDRHLAAVGLEHPLASTFVVSPTLSQITGAAASAKVGRIARRPPMLANAPSAMDDSLRPAGGAHVFSLEVLFTPYDLTGGWNDHREPERWLREFAGLVQPGFFEAIREWRLVAPPDYERDFAMPRGHAPSFAGGPLTALVGRDRELTRYRTPVPGLYLSGAGTFPGAGVSGAPGRNAAQVALADRDG